MLLFSEKFKLRLLCELNNLETVIKNWQNLDNSRGHRESRNLFDCVAHNEKLAFQTLRRRLFLKKENA